MLLSILINANLMPPRKRMKQSSNDHDSGSDSEKEKSTKENTDEPEDMKDLGIHWRDKVRGLREVNAYALHTHTLTDITLKVGIEETPLQAHRLILALASPVFEAMFYGLLAEKGDSICIPDISPDGFCCMLRYIYTEDVSFKTEVEAFKTCSAADKYCLPHLKEECEKYLSKCHLLPDNVWIFLENSLFMNMKTISDKCLEFLKRNTIQALQVNSFLETTAEAIENVLRLDTLEVKELILLESVVHWAENRASTDKDISFHELVKPLLSLIRFGALTPCEFCSFLEDNRGLINDTDALAILKHLIKPLSSSLPEWCCIKTWRSTQSGYECRSGGKPSFSERRSRSKSPRRTRSSGLLHNYSKKEEDLSEISSVDTSAVSSGCDFSTDESFSDYEGCI